MRIGMLTSSYPRYPGDLAGSFVFGLARWLASRGDSVEVLAPSPARADPEVPGVAVHAVRAGPRLFYGAGAPDNLRRPAAWLEVPGFLVELGRACRRRSAGWEALISHWLLPSGAVAALCGRGRPHLAIAHSSDVHLLARLPALARPVLGLLARRRARLVLTSESLRARLREVTPEGAARELVERAGVMRMGIAAAPAAPSREQARRQLGLERDAPLVLFLGRLVPVKGLSDLLRACAGEPRLALALVGEGPERTTLAREAARLGVSALFVGEQSGAAKAAWLAAADLLVLPSTVLADGRTESAPVVLLEAMAAGLAVVATRVGGNAELIRDGENGLLVEPGHPEALRAAIRRVVEDGAFRDRLIERGRATAAEHTWDRVGPRLRALLPS